MLETIFGSITIIALIGIFIALMHNKFQYSIIKIEEAENNIDVLLHKKLDLIRRCIPIVKKELKLDNFLEELNNIDEDNVNHFELKDVLTESYNDFVKILDENEKLLKSETLENIIKDLRSNEIELTASTKFYNDSVIVFNKLVKSFPTNIFAFFKRYKKKEFYNNEKKEMFEILNED